MIWEYVVNFGILGVKSMVFEGRSKRMNCYDSLY